MKARHRADCPPTAWSTSPGVRFAEVQGEGVILDLIADRYYGLSGAATVAWRQLFVDRSSSEGFVTSVAAVDHRPIDSSLDLTAYLSRWQAAGLVTEADAVSTVLVPRMHPAGTPAKHDLAADQLGDTALSAFAALRLGRAAWWCARERKRRGLAALLCTVQASPRPATPWDACRDELRATLRTYYALRRLIGQGRDDCLSRSLALAVAFRRLGAAVDLCFGVRKFPFLAHAWVESEGVALNERAARLDALTVVARIRTT